MNPLTFELPESQDEEAADWCMRLADGALSAAEQAEFDQWLERPGNRAAFEDALAIWRGVDEAASTPEFIDIRSDALDSYRKANTRRWLQRPQDHWRTLAAIAAVLLAVLTFSLFPMNGGKTYQTDLGERQVATLEDGSRLSLDAATKVSVRMREDKRELELFRGRAKFDVAKDPLRPFSVRVGDKLIVATGTTFSIEVAEKQVRVLLYEGQVELLEQRKGMEPRQLKLGKTHVAQPARLSPGQELITPLTQSTAIVIGTDPPRASAWEQGQLNMDNEPLSLAVERVNRYSKKPVKIADADTAGVRISGVFTAGDTEAFLEAVAAYSAVSIKRHDEEIVIRSQESEKNLSRTAVPVR